MEEIKSKRELIMEAGRKIFARDGFHRAKVGDIAEEAGIGKGTIYEYFSSKKHLFLEIIESGIDLYLAHIQQVFETKVNTGEKLILFVLMAEKLAKQHVDIVKVFSQESGEVGESIKTTMIGFQVKLVEKIESLLLQAKEHGEFRLQDAKISAITFLGGMNHLIMFRHCGENSDLSEEEIKIFVNTFLYGLENKI